MEEIILIGIAFAIGGILKGAIGAGTPLIAVPVMVSFYGVPFAIAVFAIPNLVVNLWQIWQFRTDILPRPFALRLFCGGALGALIGSLLLFSLPEAALKSLLILVVIAYIALRLGAPNWVLSYPAALRFVAPAYTLAGLFQAAAGVSAPISITYLAAMRLARPAFAGTVSLYFISIGVTQLPTLAALGLLTFDHLLYGALSLIPLFAAMPLGAWIGARVSNTVFERAILIFLAGFAAKLLWEVSGG